MGQKAGDKRRDVTLPCQFQDGTTAQTLKLDGSESVDVLGLTNHLAPRQAFTLVIHCPDGTQHKVPIIARIDTPIEVEYRSRGGILPFVLRRLLS
ncbi:MAG: hypothetical protein ABSD58_04705 [Verrucomicrobiia bacterium]